MTPMRRFLPKLYASTARCLPVRKRPCCQSFKKNKKDLTWTQTFHENVDEVFTQKEASTSGFFNPFETVKMNGFEPSSMQRQFSVGLVFTQSLRVHLCCFVLLVAHTFSAADRRLGPLQDVGAANAPRVQI